MPGVRGQQLSGRRINCRTSLATESWVGMNNYSFTGGEVSGPDTMTKTEIMVYDSGNPKGR